MPSHYESLAVHPSASYADIRAAFRKRALEAHPDKGGSEDEFRTVMTAVDVLGDACLRAAYDRTLAAADGLRVATQRPAVCKRRRRHDGEPVSRVATEERGTRAPVAATPVRQAATGYAADAAAGAHARRKDVNCAPPKPFKKQAHTNAAGSSSSPSVPTDTGTPGKCKPVACPAAKSENEAPWEMSEKFARLLERIVGLLQRLPANERRSAISEKLSHSLRLQLEKWINQSRSKLTGAIQQVVSGVDDSSDATWDNDTSGCESDLDDTANSRPALQLCDVELYGEECEDSGCETVHTSDGREPLAIADESVGMVSGIVNDGLEIEPADDKSGRPERGHRRSSQGCTVRGISSHMRRRGVTYYANITIGMVRMVSLEYADLEKVLEIHLAFVATRQRVRGSDSLPFDIAFAQAIREAFSDHGLDPLKDVSLSIIVPANYWIGTDLSTQFWRGDQVEVCLNAWRRLRAARGRVWLGGNVLFASSLAEQEATWSQLVEVFIEVVSKAGRDAQAEREKLQSAYERQQPARERQADRWNRASMLRAERCQRSAALHERRREVQERRRMAQDDWQSRRACGGGGAAASRADRWATTSRLLEHAVQRWTTLVENRLVKRLAHMHKQEEAARREEEKANATELRRLRAEREKNYRWLMRRDITMDEMLGYKQR